MDFEKIMKELDSDKLNHFKEIFVRELCQSLNGDLIARYNLETDEKEKHKIAIIHYLLNNRHLDKRHKSITRSDVISSLTYNILMDWVILSLSDEAEDYTKYCIKRIKAFYDGTTEKIISDLGDPEEIFKLIFKSKTDPKKDDLELLAKVLVDTTEASNRVKELQGISKKVTEELRQLQYHTLGKEAVH